MPGRPFVKGHKRGGRPKGSKVKTWLNVEFWYNRLNAEFFNLKPHERAKISLEVMKVLINRAKELPKSTLDAVNGNEETAELIKALESKDKPVAADSNEATALPSDLTQTIKATIQGEQTHCSEVVTPSPSENVNVDVDSSVKPTDL